LTIVSLVSSGVCQLSTFNDRNKNNV